MRFWIGWFGLLVSPVALGCDCVGPMGPEQAKATADGISLAVSQAVKSGTISRLTVLATSGRQPPRQVDYTDNCQLWTPEGGYAAIYVSHRGSVSDCNGGGWLMGMPEDELVSWLDVLGTRTEAPARVVRAAEAHGEVKHGRGWLIDEQVAVVVALDAEDQDRMLLGQRTDAGWSWLSNQSTLVRTIAMSIP